MEAAGLDGSLVRVGRAFTEPEGARLCEELLAAGARVTAIVAGNDLMALGCYDVLGARGIACPGELSVVGFNDMPFADRFAPPLTTVRIPHYEIGVAAAQLLLDLLNGEYEGPADVVLPAELVVRGSTAAPQA
jgi:LacI family transcriptional regulator